jgi:hypothetical protein
VCACVRARMGMRLCGCTGSARCLLR